MKRLKHTAVTRIRESFRFYTGLGAAFLMHLGFAGIAFRSVCTPGFACHGCPWATAACPIGATAYGMAVRSVPALALGILLAVGATTGRLVCGFICPFGWFQDLCRRIPLRKYALPRPLRYVKYAALALLVFLFPYLLGFEQPAAFIGIDPPQIESHQEPSPFGGGFGGGLGGGFGDPLAGLTGDGGGTEEGDGGDTGEPQRMVDIAFTVRNHGDAPVEGVVIEIAFEDGSGEALHSDTFEFPDTMVPPGEAVELPVVQAPNLLTRADLVYSSPQSLVLQSPKYNLYYCKVCPVGTLTASLPLQLGGETGGIYGWSTSTWVRWVVLGVFLVLMVVTLRPFCRIFCPLGALYALLAPFAVLRVRVDHDACIDCGKCDTVCPVELDVRREAGGPECIACGDCIRACPVDAIRRHAGLGCGRPQETPAPAEDA